MSPETRGGIEQFKKDLEKTFFTVQNVDLSVEKESLRTFQNKVWTERPPLIKRAPVRRPPKGAFELTLKSWWNQHILPGQSDPESSADAYMRIRTEGWLKEPLQKLRNDFPSEVLDLLTNEDWKQLGIAI